MTNYNTPVVGDPLPGPVGGGAPVFSAFSVLAIILAILSLFNVVGYSLLLAVGAVICGLLGMLVAVLPSRRGGIMSFFAVGAGLIGVVLGLIRLVGHS